MGTVERVWSPVGERELPNQVDDWQGLAQGPRDLRDDPRVTSVDPSAAPLQLSATAWTARASLNGRARPAVPTLDSNVTLRGG